MSSCHQPCRPTKVDKISFSACQWYIPDLLPTLLWLTTTMIKRVNATVLVSLPWRNRGKRLNEVMVESNQSGGTDDSRAVSHRE